MCGRRLGEQIVLRLTQRVLLPAEHIDFGYLKSKPKLTADQLKYRCKRIAFTNATKCRKAIFTHVNMFCSGGSDGSKHFWFVSRLLQDYFIRKGVGGRDVIWLIIGWKVNMKLLTFNCNSKAEEYCKIVVEHFLLYRDENYPDRTLLHEENAPAHTALYSRDYVME